MQYETDLIFKPKDYAKVGALHAAKIISKDIANIIEFSEIDRRDSFEIVETLIKELRIHLDALLVQP